MFMQVKHMPVSLYQPALLLKEAPAISIKGEGIFHVYEK
jgi:hypothetical protein